MSSKRNITHVNGITKCSGTRILVMLGLVISVIVAGCVDKGNDDKVTPTPVTTSVTTPKETPKETPNETPETRTLVVRKGDKSASSPSTPITIDMSIPITLSSDNTVEIDIVVKSIDDAPNTTVDLVLPEGVSMVSDKSTWNVNLTKNVPVNLSAKIQINADGELEISAVAKKIIDKDSVWGDIAVVYIGFEDDNGIPGKLE